MTPAVAARDDRLSARITEVRALPGVHAGSALLRLGPRLLAIQDDAFMAVWVEPATLKAESLVLRGAGEPLAKAMKPDFEAAFLHAGHAWVLGSGARPNRCLVARLDLESGEAVVLDALPLFGALGRAIGGTPNIEGAVAQDGRLTLFHRGPGRGDAPSWTLDVNAGVLAWALPQVLAAQAWDLGAIDGVRLAFSDAVRLDARRLLYLAVAEDTADGIADGAIAGSALGVIEGGMARWTPLLEAGGTPCRRKVEGIALDEGGRGAWLLTDPDDAARPAELCRLEIIGAR